MNEVRVSLARMMPDALPIFFHRRQPYEVQSEVMPLVVRGESVLFAAPTASGKTEAAICPLFQRHLSHRRKALSTVYLAPTKALVNDLYERLAGYLGARFPNAITRYTGDRHELKDPEGVFCLLATPEALDSLQLRRPAALATVRAIVIDEIHLLHGQARGQQLRHVIHRVQAAARSPADARDRFQVVGMTATLDDMQGVAHRWLGPAARVVSSGKPREIGLELLSIDPDADASREQARELAKWLGRTGTEKVLVFSNSRNGAHALAANLHRELEGSRWPVHLHFGPLAAWQREQVEEEMRSRRFGVCVATSTLEIGIDIGDVDAVVLADAPFTVSAFLQRIGRGNRRSGLCRVIGFRTCDADERYLRGLIDCGTRGELDDTFEYDRPSVQFQQVLSIAWRATRREEPVDLARLAAETGQDMREVVEDMIDTGSLRDVRGALIPSDQLLDEADAGRIHSVIVGAPGPSVIDFRTGEAALREADESSAGGALFVGGQLRKLGLGADGSAFLGEAAPHFERLAKIKGGGRGQGLGRAVVRGLARQLDQDPDVWRLDGVSLVTWGGLPFNTLLAAILNREAPDYEFLPSDLEVRGPFDKIPFGISWLRDATVKARAANDLPQRICGKFTGSSKYLTALSAGLASEERRRSIPWEPFARWLTTDIQITAASGEDAN
jgi:ATP-dependent Lhr-like helicase